jgi:hypothetical protein
MSGYRGITFTKCKLLQIDGPLLLHKSFNSDSDFPHAEITYLVSAVAFGMRRFGLAVRQKSPFLFEDTRSYFK